MKQTKKLLAVLLCLLCLLPASVLAGAESNEIRNVILMIGDGMGYNHLKLAEEQGYEIFMDDAPDLFGWSRTRSASDRVTDSAAGATALACGVRTNNGMLGVFPGTLRRKYVQPRSFTENAIAHGMKTGIVTSDLTSGATPAGFSAHTLSRNNTEDIVAQQLQGKLDLIWGKDEPLARKEDARAAGLVYLKTKEDLQALDTARSYGQFTNPLWTLDPEPHTPTLAELSEKAIDLLSAGDRGFFLMIEGAHIDKLSDDSQNNKYDYPEKLRDTSIAVKGFDNAVRAAVEFARRDGHTLVLITADHETGKISYDKATNRMTFHSDSHTDADVPVLVYGSDDLFRNGEKMNNRDIPNLIAEKLGWSERFPIEDPLDPNAPQTKNLFRAFFIKIETFFLDLPNKLRDFFTQLFRK